MTHDPELAARLAVLCDLMDEESTEVIERLSEEFGSGYGPLTRIAEDLATRCVYAQFRERGEPQSHAIRRTAQRIGLTPSAARFRLVKAGVL